MSLAWLERYAVVRIVAVALSPATRMTQRPVEAPLFRAAVWRSSFDRLRQGWTACELDGAGVKSLREDVVAER